MRSVIQLLGLALLVLEVWAARFLFRALRAHPFGWRPCATVLALGIAGALAAYACSHVEYASGTPDRRYAGFPFVWAIFERKGGAWTDFVSPLTVVAAALDQVVPLGLPALGLAVYLRLRRHG